ncbi:hypothetical protein D3C84_1274070 [compost metagenome]
MSDVKTKTGTTGTANITTAGLVTISSTDVVGFKVTVVVNGKSSTIDVRTN